jgi:hypothetical protein
MRDPKAIEARRLQAAYDAEQIKFNTRPGKYYSSTGREMSAAEWAVKDIKPIKSVRQKQAVPKAILRRFNFDE